MEREITENARSFRVVHGGIYTWNCNTMEGKLRLKVSNCKTASSKAFGVSVAVDSGEIFFKNYLTDDTVETSWTRRRDRERRV